MNAKANYVVTRNGNKIEKLNKKQEAIFAFMGSAYKIGDTVTKQRLIKEFSKWNDKNEVVEVGTIPTDKDIRIVCEFAYFKYGDVVDALPMLVYNNGVATVQMMAKDNAVKYISKKNATVKEKTPVDPMEFIQEYISKHSEEIDINTLKDFVNAL